MSSILNRARRADRGSRIAELIQHGLSESDDDEIAEYFGIKVSSKDKKKKKPAAQKDDDDDDEDESGSSASGSDDDDSDDDDDSSSSEEDDDDSTFKASNASSDKLASDFGDHEVSSTDSDAEPIDDGGGGGGGRKKQKQKGPGGKQGAGGLVGGGAKNSSSNIKALRERKQRPKIDAATQAERMRAATEYAAGQSGALRQKEEMYDNAEKIVAERVKAAIAQRRKRRQRKDGDDAGDDEESEFGRPVYVSNAALLRDFGVAHVIVYPGVAPRVKPPAGAAALT
jgi:hypothetical protein